MRPLRGLQETRVATREVSGVLVTGQQERAMQMPSLYLKGLGRSLSKGTATPVHRPQRTSPRPRAFPQHRNRVGDECTAMPAPSAFPCFLEKVTFQGIRRGEGYCVVGRASRDSAGFSAMEECLISRGGRNLRFPLRF